MTMLRHLRALIFVTGLAAAFVSAQNGDNANEAQPPPPIPVPIPPAPALPPDQALKTFQLPPGFRIELVAAEPLVDSPVAMQFDPNGHLWVIELHGYMPNVDGQGEDQPVGRIVVLEDTNSDGKMDKRTVFLDGLIMPRALCLVRNG